MAWPHTQAQMIGLLGGAQHCPKHFPLACWYRGLRCRRIMSSAWESARLTAVRNVAPNPPRTASTLDAHPRHWHEIRDWLMELRQKTPKRRKNKSMIKVVLGRKEKEGFFFSVKMCPLPPISLQSILFVLISGVQLSERTLIYFRKCSPWYFQNPTGPVHSYGNIIDCISYVLYMTVL